MQVLRVKTLILKQLLPTSTSIELGGISEENLHVYIGTMAKTLA